MFRCNIVGVFMREVWESGTTQILNRKKRNMRERHCLFQEIKSGSCLFVNVNKRKDSSWSLFLFLRSHFPTLLAHPMLPSSRGNVSQNSVLPCLTPPLREGDPHLHRPNQPGGFTSTVHPACCDSAHRTQNPMSVPRHSPLFPISLSLPAISAYAMSLVKPDSEPSASGAHVPCLAFL